MKRYKVSLNSASIRKTIAELEQLKKRLQGMEDSISARLAEIGAVRASLYFQIVEYDGVNDVTVDVEKTENGYRVTANGESVAFIEFGTGIMKGDSYPAPRSNYDGVVPIGTYGKHRGSHESWVYRGSPGSNGEVLKNGAILTHGNRANACMFQTAMDLKTEIARIVKEEITRAYA